MSTFYVKIVGKIYFSSKPICQRTLSCLLFSGFSAKLLLLLFYTANGLPEGPVEVEAAGVTAGEAQVVGEDAAALVGSTAPLVAVAGLIDERAVVAEVAVSGSREKNAVCPAAKNTTVNSRTIIICYPFAP
ncbi:MAG: hypothetical protein LBR51_00610 [Bacteroidales bacterium]|jgi:hypothetical protein|nr:hypothetical protein [Bacteroidales bacterium]